MEDLATMYGYMDRWMEWTDETPIYYLPSIPVLYRACCRAIASGFTHLQVPSINILRKTTPKAKMSVYGSMCASWPSPIILHDARHSITPDCFPIIASYTYPSCTRLMPEYQLRASALRSRLSCLVRAVFQSRKRVEVTGFYCR